LLLLSPSAVNLIDVHDRKTWPAAVALLRKFLEVKNGIFALRFALVRRIA
jgi:hypothetical protein